jgi:hypothetical protein
VLVVVKGALHAVQMDAPVLLVYVPAAQAEHCAPSPPGEYDPAGQGSQPMPLKLLPGSHTETGRREREEGK